MLKRVLFSICLPPAFGKSSSTQNPIRCHRPQFYSARGCLRHGNSCARKRLRIRDRNNVCIRREYRARNPGRPHGKMISFFPLFVSRAGGARNEKGKKKLCGVAHTQGGGLSGFAWAIIRPPLRGSGKWRTQRQPSTGAGVWNSGVVRTAQCGARSDRARRLNIERQRPDGCASHSS